MDKSEQIQQHEVDQILLTRHDHRHFSHVPTLSTGLIPENVFEDHMIMGRVRQRRILSEQYNRYDR